MGRVGRLLIAAALAVAVGGWTQPQQLETGQVWGAALGGDGHGHRVAAWLSDGRVRVASADRGRDFGAARTVASTGETPGDLHLAVGRRGDALVVWGTKVQGETTPGGGFECCRVLHAVLLSRDGSVAGPFTLSRRSTHAFYVVVGAGSRGRFGVAWSNERRRSRFARIASIRDGFGPLERVPGRGVNSSLTFDRRHARVQSLLDVADVQEAVRAPSGRWSQPVSLFRRPGIDAVEFGADARGGQVAVSHIAAFGARIGMRNPPGPLRSSALLPDASSRIIPRLAVAGSGASVVAWQRDFAHSVGGDVYVRLRSPGRAFGPDELVFTWPRQISVQSASVAPDGYAAVGVEVGEDPYVEPRVALIRPGGGVRSVNRVTAEAPRVVTDVAADTHGAAALLLDTQSSRGLWVVRAR